MASHALTLTPFGYDGGGSGSSMMKSLAFFLLFAGLLLISSGYMKSQQHCPAPRVEFRYVPRTFEQEQDVPVPVLSVYGKMFTERDPWMKDHYFVDQYPWDHQLIDSRVVTYESNPLSGVGRAPGTRII